MIELNPEALRRLPLPGYDAGADKRDRGKLLLIAGSAELPGAALLAARAAMRVGCGTVRLALPAALAPHLGIAQPELMVLALEPGAAGRQRVREQLPVCDAVAVGPGLAADAALVRMVAEETECPVLFDAGALADLPDAPGPGPRVLTPHPGELARMMGRDVPEEVRAGVALELARVRGAIVVAKGHPTYIATAQGQLYRCPPVSRALGAAGSGDALAGAIAGLLTQGLSPLAAAAWGVTLHAMAGEALAAELGADGVLASEVVDRLPRVLSRQRAAKEAGALP